jgi:hypothetical protein
MSEAKWAEISGYSRYMVSDSGAIFSKERKVMRLGRMVKTGGINLSPDTSRDGYSLVCLTDDNNKRKMLRLHRVVLISFCGYPEDKNMTQVNHINGIKSDNTLSNLEWVTPSQNTSHAFRLGLIKKPCGAGNAKKGLSNLQKLEISNSKESLSVLSKKFGVSIWAIRRIIKKHSNT